ncbi:MAG: TIGR02281 family clan AA aspartic protease [Methylococcales bacterium]
MPDKSKDFTARTGKFMVFATWILLLGILTYLFNNYLEKQNNPNTTLNTETGANGIAEVVLQRNRYGHYVAKGAINGQSVTFLLDTGATIVSIPQTIAGNLGLRKGAPMTASTANGSITVYATRLDSISLGSIGFNNIRAHINPHMGSREILLGMNFMKNLEMIQRGDQLILRQYPNTNYQGMTKK